MPCVTELHELSALEQAAAIASGDVTPAELVEHYLARIETVGAGLGAFVTVTADAARAQAGESRPAEAGPLWGVPTAIKDNMPTAGVRTTFGSRAYERYVPDVD